MADLEKLYNPVSSPFEDAVASGVQSTFNTGRFSPEVQAMTQSLSGTNPKALPPNMPIGSGNTMYQGPMFGQEDIGNVGGVVGTNQEPLEAYIPYQADNTEQQTTDFHAAAAGTDGKLYTRTNMLGQEVEATGRSAARGAKRADRQADRAARKEAGLKGGEKRRARRAQRRERKDSWKDYKADEAATAAEF
jgi:hypothetical protein